MATTKHGSSEITYTIQQASRLCGLPESTLRYYERIGLMRSILRDETSRHRVYGEDDIDLAISIACLNATGLSIEDMRSYLLNRTKGVRGAREQVKLLTSHKKRLEDEIRSLQLRIRYVDAKVSYWNAIASDKPGEARACAAATYAIADEMNLPRRLPKGRSHGRAPQGY